MQNSDIRTAAAKAGVWLWQIAERLGMTDSNFSRKLRRELAQNEKEKIFGVIDELAKEAEK